MYVYKVMVGVELTNQLLLLKIGITIPFKPAVI